MNRRLSAGLLLLCTFLAGTATAGDEPAHPVTMWQLTGHANRIYLLGSIHLLRAGDHPLPAAIDAAYRDAEQLVMEMDVDDVDPAEMQKAVTELGVIQDGRSLADLMGPDRYARAQTIAASVNVPLALLASTEPWLAAITVEQMVLTRLGFDPKYGVEKSLAAKAAKDKKEITGFETVRQQLAFLDGMSLEAQRELLLQSLEESRDVESIMDDLVHAWRYGDTGFLERQMLSDIKDYPELYKTIVVQRNQRWAERIEQLANEDDDYLIVVGALHLIGDNGLPSLLEQRGYVVKQLREK